MPCLYKPFSCFYKNERKTKKKKKNEWWESWLSKFGQPVHWERKWQNSESFVVVVVVWELIGTALEKLKPNGYTMEEWLSLKSSPPDVCEILTQKSRASRRSASRTLPASKLILFQIFGSSSPLNSILFKAPKMCLMDHRSARGYFTHIIMKNKSFWWRMLYKYTEVCPSFLVFHFSPGKFSPTLLLMMPELGLGLRSECRHTAMVLSSLG